MIRSRLGDEVALLKPLIVTNRREILEVPTQVKDVDVLLAFPIVYPWGIAQSVMIHVDVFKKPVIFYNRRNFPRTNVCSAYGRIRSDGLVEAEIALTPEDVAWFLHLHLTLKKIRKTRIVVFGQPGLSVPDSIYDPRALSDRFGLWSETVSIQELMREYNKVRLEGCKVLAEE